MTPVRWRRTRWPVTAAVAIWLIAYLSFYPVQNLLWTCNVALLLTAVALWVPGTRRLLSLALIIALIADMGWVLDVSVAALAGQHLIGGTEYMFRDDIPLGIRVLSFEHAVLPLLLVWLLRPVGYDRGALVLAAGGVLPLFYLTWAIGDPHFAVNWVWGLFGQQQDWTAPLVYPAIAALIYVLAIVLPGHYLALTFLRVGPGKLRAPVASKEQGS